MADTVRKTLPGHPARGTTAASGCASAFLMVFGLPFMAGGVAGALLALGVIPMSARNGPLPAWLPWAFSIIFFAPGLFLFSSGVRSLFAASRIKRLRAQHPHEPWLVDGEWEPEGTSDQPRSSLVSQVAVFAFMAVFLSPFNYFVFVKPQKEVPFWVRGLVGLFDLILVLILVGILTTLWHRAKYGHARLAFSIFPFYMGGPLQVRLSTPRSMSQLARVVCTLRCIEERSEVRRTSKGTSHQTVCDQVWCDEKVIERPGGFDGGDLPVSFKLPDGELGTRLTEAPARYWELEVKADTPGLDFGAVFLLPVYARPRF